MMNPDFPDPSAADAQIEFSCEDIQYHLHESEKIVNWLKACILEEQFKLNHLQYIFCSDKFLHNLNLRYLDHDTLTDVITFPYSTEAVEGDIFISVDRTKDNAEQMGISSRAELHRVMVHGLLHLMHYKDKTEEERATMREKENYYLAQLME